MLHKDGYKFCMTLLRAEKALIKPQLGALSTLWQLNVIGGQHGSRDITKALHVLQHLHADATNMIR
jgi:hypothetical protein